MIEFNATILKFENKGEKSGWTYIEISESLAQQINPGCKKSFRVKGKLDNYAIKQIALIPMGSGNFIMPLNATMRKNIGKKKGAQVTVRIEVDNEPLMPSSNLMVCLETEPDAMSFYTSLAKSHQQYFSKWIESAKTEQTKTKRIVQTVNALSRNRNFAEMMRALKAEKEK